MTDRQQAHHRISASAFHYIPTSDIGSALQEAQAQPNIAPRPAVVARTSFAPPQRPRHHSTAALPQPSAAAHARDRPLLGLASVQARACALHPSGYGGSARFARPSAFASDSDPTKARSALRLPLWSMAALELSHHPPSNKLRTNTHIRPWHAGLGQRIALWTEMRLLRSRQEAGLNLQARPDENPGQRERNHHSLPNWLSRSRWRRIHFACIALFQPFQDMARDKARSRNPRRRYRRCIAADPRNQARRPIEQAAELDEPLMIAPFAPWQVPQTLCLRQRHHPIKLRLGGHLEYSGVIESATRLPTSVRTK